MFKVIYLPLVAAFFWFLSSIEVLKLICLLLGATFIWFLLRKIGYSKTLSTIGILAFLTPVFNLAVLYYLINSEWPIEKQARQLRLRLGIGTAVDHRLRAAEPPILLREAVQCEAHCHLDRARVKYQQIIAEFPTSPERSEAEICLASLERTIEQITSSNSSVSRHANSQNSS